MWSTRNIHQILDESDSNWTRTRQSWRRCWTKALNQAISPVRLVKRSHYATIRLTRAVWRSFTRQSLSTQAVRAATGCRHGPISAGLKLERLVWVKPGDKLTLHSRKAARIQQVYTPVTHAAKDSDSALMGTRDTPSVRGGYYRKRGAACWFNSVQGRSRRKKKTKKTYPPPPTWNCLLHASVCGVSFLRCGAALAVCLQKRCQDSSLRNGGL